MSESEFDKHVESLQRAAISSVVLLFVATYSYTTHLEREKNYYKVEELMTQYSLLTGNHPGWDHPHMREAHFLNHLFHDWSTQCNLGAAIAAWKKYETDDSIPTDTTFTTPAGITLGWPLPDGDQVSLGGDGDLYVGARGPSRRFDPDGNFDIGVTLRIDATRDLLAAHPHKFVFYFSRVIGSADMSFQRPWVVTSGERPKGYLGFDSLAVGYQIMSEASKWNITPTSPSQTYLDVRREWLNNAILLPIVGDAFAASWTLIAFMVIALALSISISSHMRVIAKEPPARRDYGRSWTERAAGMVEVWSSRVGYGFVGLSPLATGVLSFMYLMTLDAHWFLEIFSVVTVLLTIVPTMSCLTSLLRIVRKQAALDL